MGVNGRHWFLRIRRASQSWSVVLMATKDGTSMVSLSSGGVGAGVDLRGVGGVGAAGSRWRGGRVMATLTVVSVGLGVGGAWRAARAWLVGGGAWSP